MTEKKDTPQEIDLIELFTNVFNWIGRQIKWVYGIGLRVFYFFVRNSPWFALSILLGVATGYFKFETSEPYYKSELVGFSHTISNIEVIQNINNWNYAAEFNDEELEMIKDVGATYVLDINKDGLWDIIEDIQSVKEVDTAMMSQRLYGNFCIQIEVYDTTIISKIQSKVLEYIENNKRVKELNRIRIKQQEELIPKLQKEMAELDSLKRKEYFGNQKDKTIKMGEVLLVGEKEQRLYHGEVLSLFKQEQAIERSLVLYKNPFEVILDFSTPRNAVDERTPIILGFVKRFLALGFLIILFFDQRKFIMLQIRRSKEDIID